MGQTATLDCYDPITANKFEDYYIQLEFKSLFEKKNIVHYRVSYALLFTIITSNY